MVVDVTVAAGASDVADAVAVVAVLAVLAVVDGSVVEVPADEAAFLPLEPHPTRARLSTTTGRSTRADRMAVVRLPPPERLRPRRWRTTRAPERTRGVPWCHPTGGVACTTT